MRNHYIVFLIPRPKFNLSHLRALPFLLFTLCGLNLCSHYDLAFWHSVAITQLISAKENHLTVMLIKWLYDGLKYVCDKAFITSPEHDCGHAIPPLK